MDKNVEHRRRGYCFNCSTEFKYEKLTQKCPNCGSDHWVQEPPIHGSGKLSLEAALAQTQRAHESDFVPRGDVVLYGNQTPQKKEG